ncbi:3-oxoacyl-ACP synthase III family protein [Portibacter lacus]|uniref:3-oxoacyl-[acyl-carrier-protein] synthase 3 n=1 Tax=Portibacter lacus TaxID=1099794 RepID=A0AA37SWC8_9BACT|nr:ketoacyl-ACP synthase III [Portibacter lacus]GLR20016.1 3-oxoacyl-[acyl-carrier-protein] synthase 3 [Portibacter lacus]
MFRNARIVSTGSYAPENIVPNSYFDKTLNTNVSDWLEEVVQIKERRWVSENQTTSDLCYEAAINCLKNGNISASDVDLIIIATDTPDFISPSTAAIVQDKLKATNAGTFDINSACAGFVTALDIGAKYIRADKQYNNVLVIGGYAMSRHLNKSDKKTVTLFADGAGAVLLQSVDSEDAGFLASELKSMGQYNGYMGVYAGGTAQPVDVNAIENHDHKLKFVNRFPKEINPTTWSEMALTLNERLGVQSDDVDMYFITQLNINSIWEMLDILDVPKEKAHTIMHHYGYTGSACIPMAFHDAWEKKLVKPGDLIYFIGSGGGLAFASAAFRL